MRYFSNDASELVFAAPSTKIAVLGGVALALGASFLAASWAIGEAGAANAALFAAALAAPAGLRGRFSFARSSTGPSPSGSLWAMP